MHALSRSAIICVLGAVCAIGAAKPVFAQNTGTLGDPVDVGLDFRKPYQPVFVASRLASFDAATGQGSLQWDRYALGPTLSFNKIDVVYQRAPLVRVSGHGIRARPQLAVRYLVRESACVAHSLQHARPAAGNDARRTKHHVGRARPHRSFVGHAVGR